MWDFDFAASNEVKNIIHYDDFYKEFGNNKDINPVYDIHIFTFCYIYRDMKVCSGEACVPSLSKLPCGLPFPSVNCLHQMQ